MGNFCEGCCRCDEESTREERVSLIREGGASGGGVRENPGNGIHDGGADGRTPSDKQSAEYFQAIIDEATNKFISSSRPWNQGGMGSDPEELRLKLTSMSLGRPLNSPPQEGILRLAATTATPSSSSVGSVGTGSLQQQVVVDILSEPVKVVTSQLEVAIDELAELVASQAFGFRVEEGEHSVVAKFK